MFLSFNSLNKLLAGCMIVGLMGPADLTPAEVRVVVRPESEVSGAGVMLGDIADVMSCNAELSDRIQSTAVCSAPLPGRSRLLTRDHVVTSLKRSGVYTDDMSILSPAEIRVNRASGIVTGDALFEAAREYALTSITWQETVEIEPVRLPADQIVPVGEVELRPKSGIGGVRRGRSNMPVEILVDGKTYRTVYVSILIKSLARVPVASRQIQRSEQITSDNVSYEDRDITFMPEDIVTDTLDPGLTASVPIPQGAVLRRNWVAEPPVIRNGDEVIVEVTNGRVRVNEKGTAAQDGRVGDRIRVRLDGPGREIRGIVHGSGIVSLSMR